MDLFSLIPMALSALGGLFGGNNTSTTTSAPVVDPLVKSSMTDLINRAKVNFTKPYQQYTGDRVANPSASRESLNPVMSAINDKVAGSMGDANGYKARIAQIMNTGPSRVTVPSMVPGGAQVGYQGMPGVAGPMTGWPMLPQMPQTSPPGTGGPMLPQMPPSSGFSTAVPTPPPAPVYTPPAYTQVPTSTLGPGASTQVPRSTLGPGASTQVPRHGGGW